MSVLEIIAVVALLGLLALMVAVTRRAAAHRKEQRDVIVDSFGDGDGGGD